MTLHLVRIPINLRGLAAFAVERGASDDDHGYALHLALRARFGTAGPQPFRLFADGPGVPHLLGYTADPDALKDMVALPCTEALLGDVFAGPPELRTMPEQWRAGARYGFDVRVRPVVRFGKRRQEERAGTEAAQVRENWWARAGEVDAWIAARTREGGDAGVTRGAAYADWLTARLLPLATLDGVELAQFRRVQARRSTHGKPTSPRVEGPAAVMTGTLTVTDPAALLHALTRGIGRHVAFGYGMLLLSPPRPGR